MLLASDISPVQRDRTLHVVSRLIVPVIGHVLVCELDDDLVHSVRRVLAAQLRRDQAVYTVCVWMHFAGWVRYQAAPPERRSLARLDADVTGVHDELADG